VQFKQTTPGASGHTRLVLAVNVKRLRTNITRPVKRRRALGEVPQQAKRDRAVEAFPSVIGSKLEEAVVARVANAALVLSALPEPIRIDETHAHQWTFQSLHLHEARAHELGRKNMPTSTLVQGPVHWLLMR
jgi:hypothetical protein